jgi:hypothetical protein
MGARVKFLLVVLLIAWVRVAHADGKCSCDATGDQVVGGPDFALFLAQLGTQCPETGGVCGDCTGDDLIGGPDFDLLADQLGDSCPKGDLNVADDRLLTPEGVSLWPPPPEPADTSGWQVITVDGCDPADSETDDAACVNAAIAAANAGSAPTVVFFPAGTYNFPNDQTLRVTRSNVVLRCDDPATTTLEFGAQNTQLCLPSPGYNTNAHICFAGGGASAPVAWVGGFGDDERVLHISNTAAFSPGDWVIASMGVQGQMDACLDGYLSPGLMKPENFDHVTRLTAVSSANGTVTIDRPLRMSYGVDAPDCGPQHIRRIQMIENVGIENCRIDNVDNTKMVYRSGIAFERVARAWATNISMDNYHNVFIVTNGSRDVLVAHSQFENLYAGGSFNTQGVHWAHTTDGYTLDNIFENVRVASECEQGGEGIVYAYNYVVPGFADRERSFFVHGQYCRTVLAEGNDADAAIQADTFWGRNGPRNTFYRNRHRNNLVGSNPNAFYVSFHGWGDEGRIAGERFTVIGNSGNWFMNGPWFPLQPTTTESVHDYDLIAPWLWLERNLATSHFNLIAPRGETGCGTEFGHGDCLAGGAGFIGDNAEGDAAPPEWKSFQLPPSLFLKGVPSWWCQEACRFDEAGIGALGDDFSGPLCKLPAQIRHEGGTCTPVN